MSLWKILTSPSGVEGCRASVEAAVKQNLKRVNQGSPFMRRTIAAAHALSARHRIVGREFDPSIIGAEVAPFAWDERRVAVLVAEYVVDQEFPQKTAKPFVDLMPDVLHNFVTADDAEVRNALGLIFMRTASGRLFPHWMKWLRADTLELIYDIGRANLREKMPDVFED